MSLGIKKLLKGLSDECGIKMKPQVRRRKTIKVVRIKLGRQKAWGQSDGFFTVEIDEAARGLKYCEILYHE